MFWKSQTRGLHDYPRKRNPWWGWRGVAGWDILFTITQETKDVKEGSEPSHTVCPSVLLHVFIVGTVYTLAQDFSALLTSRHITMILCHREMLIETPFCGCTILGLAEPQVTLPVGELLGSSPPICSYSQCWSQSLCTSLHLDFRLLAYSDLKVK